MQERRGPIISQSIRQAPLEETLAYQVCREGDWAMEMETPGRHFTAQPQPLVQPAEAPTRVEKPPAEVFVFPSRGNPQPSPLSPFKRPAKVIRFPSKDVPAGHFGRAARWLRSLLVQSRLAAGTFLVRLH